MPKPETKTHERPLTALLAGSGLTYQKALELIHRGRIRGRKDQGHWVADERDFERIVRERQANAVA